jgi:hypothetical protein
LDSLLRLTDGQAPSRFVIHSGTALTIDGEDQFPANQVHPFMNSVTKSVSGVISMLRTDRDVKDSCQDDPRQVALLIEAATMPGATVRKAVEKEHLETKDLEKKGLPSLLCVDIFKFPREIASLRNAL